MTGRDHIQAAPVLAFVGPPQCFNGEPKEKLRTMPGLLTTVFYFGAGAGAGAGVVGRCMGAPVVSRGADLFVPEPVVAGEVAAGRVSVATVERSDML